MKPQRSRQFELGLQLGFLDNRLNVELTGYTMKTYNQILNGTLPQSSGFTSVVLNRGSLGNKGLEFVINATPVRTKDFTGP